MSSTEVQFDTIFSSNDQQITQPTSYPPGSLVKISFHPNSSIHPSSLEQRVGRYPFRDEPSREYVHAFIACHAPELKTVMVYLYDPTIPQNAQYTGQLTIGLDEILSIELLSPPSQSSNITTIPKAEIDNKIQTALKHREERAKAINPHVSSSSQELYLLLAKTLRCAWSGDDIVVNGNVIVQSPHKEANVHPYDASKNTLLDKPTNQAAFEHVKKMVKTFYS